MLWQVRCVGDVHCPHGLVVSHFVSSVEVDMCPVWILGSVRITNMPYSYWRSPWILAICGAVVIRITNMAIFNTECCSMWYFTLNSHRFLTWLLCLFMTEFVYEWFGEKGKLGWIPVILALNNLSVYVLTARVWFWAFALIFGCGCVMLGSWTERGEGGVKCAGFK